MTTRALPLATAPLATAPQYESQTLGCLCTTELFFLAKTLASLGCLGRKMQLPVEEARGGEEDGTGRKEEQVEVF